MTGPDNTGRKQADYLGWDEAPALETLDSLEGDALDVATFLRAELMTGASE